MHRILFPLAAGLFGVTSFAQEFNCQVSVIAPQVANARPELWKAMETSVREYMNNRRWTNLNYTAAERIDLNFLLTIQSQPATDRFSGTLQVIYARPVFGTDYNTPILDLVDNNVEFQYLEGAQVDFSLDRFISNISSIFGFYAYFVLGLDGDSFKPLGGTEFYNMAQQVVVNAQNAAESGWKAFEENKNRYWLLDNQLQAAFRPFRECLYDYHRLGMDQMTTSAVDAQKNIAASIEKLKTVHQAKPGSYNLQVFFNAKSNELVDIFTPVPATEKTKLYNTLQIIDPGNISKYQGMMRGS
jgi:hypothetical protein